MSGNGMCGDNIPAIKVGDGPTVMYFCELEAGHLGWHQFTQHPLHKPMRWMAKESTGYKALASWADDNWEDDPA